VVGPEEGALVPVGDVEQMAARALDLLRDPARLQEARAAAVRSAARYSADRIVPMYEDLYRRVLSQ
jgi:glycosyltransferase involved in cell wall biosynthesis